MRINKFIALGSTLSRRGADRAIQMERVRINGQLATPGSEATVDDTVTLDDQLITPPETLQTILMNKPVGYVCSKRGQGNVTIYELLPESMRVLNPVGRLDKDTSGLLLLTNDGELAQRLTHPSNQKNKVYEVKLNKPLDPADVQKITHTGVLLGDGVSKFQLEPLGGGDGWRITMHEGRNRQIRRTFQALDYKITKLHRTHFGDYDLGDTPSGNYKTVN